MYFHGSAEIQRMLTRHSICTDEKYQSGKRERENACTCIPFPHVVLSALSAAHSALSKVTHAHNAKTRTIYEMRADRRIGATFV